MLFGTCAYSRKTAFWELIENAGAPILYILRLTSMRLYSSRGACSLRGACATKRDNAVFEFIYQCGGTFIQRPRMNVLYIIACCYASEGDSWLWLHIRLNYGPFQFVAGEYVGHNADPIPESNISNRILQTMGWSPGTGLGADGLGITTPIVAYRKNSRKGLGATAQAPSWD